METKVVNKLPTRGANAALILNIADNQPGPEFDLPEEAKKAITRALKRGDLSDTANSTLTLHDVPGLSIPRVVVLRCGKPRADRPAASVEAIGNGIAAALKQTQCDHAMIVLDALNCPPDMPIDICAQVLSATLAAKQYQFREHHRQNPPTAALKTLTFIVDKEIAAQVKRGAAQGVAIAAGMAITKDLGNTAPNICTPEYLAKQARKLAKGDKFMKVTVLDEAGMEKLGMGAFLAVSQGSRQPARLIAMNYAGGNKSQKPIVLVGKGVTFDSGGISIKSSASMDEMKFDMCGAATVFGVMKACQMLGLKLNLIGVVAAAENMPDGNACRPGDVVHTLSGQSVEILNTDAEGRLVLCDTLTWVEQFKPKAVVDMATLTGACVVALGNVCSAVLGNDQALVDELYAAGQESADTTWPLPLWDDYQKQLDSNFADIANLGGSGAGAITAACFLSRFTENYPWAHLDIAGIAWNSGTDKGATGRPVPMLMQWLMSQST